MSKFSSREDEIGDLSRFGQDLVRLCSARVNFPSAYDLHVNAGMHAARVYKAF
ncbi:hypothetical protein ACXR0O_22165 [Verrucomicrobiota bacterium sgz303538]